MAPPGTSAVTSRGWPGSRAAVGDAVGMSAPSPLPSPRFCCGIASLLAVRSLWFPCQPDMSGLLTLANFPETSCQVTAHKPTSSANAQRPPQSSLAIKAQIECQIKTHIRYCSDRARSGPLARPSPEPNYANCRGPRPQPDLSPTSARPQPEMSEAERLQIPATRT